MVVACLPKERCQPLAFGSIKKKCRKTELYILFKNPSCEGELLYWSTDIISEIAYKLF